MILLWRRTDVLGLERLALTVSPDEVVAESTIVCLEDGGFRLDHRWRLSPDWRARSLEVERWGAAEHRRLVVERAGDGDGSGDGVPNRWLVDGEPRPDLDGTEDPDLSVTPFCNTFPIRRTPTTPGDTLTLDTCYIDAAGMTVQRSRQRYERVGPNRVRYVDLGVASGFEADLDVDADGLVLRYEHVFERVRPTSPSSDESRQAVPSAEATRYPEPRPNERTSHDDQ